MTDNEIPPGDDKWLETLWNRLPGSEYYKSLDGISTDRYLSLRHSQLGDRALSRHRIYLDQKYWNYCRDALRGQPQRPEHSRILVLLYDLVRRGICICPTSQVVLEETLKQTDPDSRKLTSELIDGLSAGVCLQPYTHFVGFEIYHWLKSSQPSNNEIDPVERFAWTYPINALGVSIPYVEALPDKANELMQKLSFDFTAQMPFSELVENLVDCPGVDRRKWDEHYRKQDEQCALHRGEFKTFKEAFLLELRGALDVEGDALREAWTLYYERDYGKEIPRVSNAELDDITNTLRQAIYAVFASGKITTQMPSLRIPVGLHAAIRHENRRHRMGDVEDHMHATLALPYCDAFFTEKALGNLLTREPLSYDRLYACTVLWQDSDIIHYLEALTESTSEVAVPTTALTTPARLPNAESLPGS